MLEANKSRWFEKIFAVYNRNLLKRRFSSFNVSGLNQLINQSNEIPQIIYANHSSWWDGLLIFEICRRTNLDLYVLMEEKQLKNLPLFRRLGAFSVIREKPREAVKSINYAVEILKTNPPKMLLIFPQGEILPNDVRPLIFFNGLSKIVGKTGKCAVFPLAIHYEFLNEFKPEIFVKIAEPVFFTDEIKFNVKTSTLSFAKNLTETLDELKSEITLKKLDNFTDLFHK